MVFKLQIRGIYNVPTYPRGYFIGHTVMCFSSSATWRLSVLIFFYLSLLFYTSLVFFLVYVYCNCLHFSMILILLNQHYSVLNYGLHIVESCFQKRLFVTLWCWWTCDNVYSFITYFWRKIYTNQSILMSIIFIVYIVLMQSTLVCLLSSVHTENT